MSEQSNEIAAVRDGRRRMSDGKVRGGRGGSRIVIAVGPESRADREGFRSE